MEDNNDLTNESSELHEGEVSPSENTVTPQQKKGKKGFLPLILILLVLVAGGVFFYVFAKDKLLKDYAIKVNSQIVDKVEFNKIYSREMDKAKEFLAKQNGDAASRQAEIKKVEDKIKNKIIEQLTIRLLLLDDAIKKGFAADEKEVDAEVSGLKTKIGSEKFDEILKKENMSIDYIKDDIKKRMIVQKYLNNMMNGIKMDDKEAEDYFNKNSGKFQRPEMVRASHILVKTEDEAKNILKKLNSGADFGKLAAEYSIDPSAKMNKGDLNFFPKGSMLPEFEKVAFSTPVGKTSNIVKTQFGYHIIKVTDKQAPQDFKFEQVKEVIKKEMVTSKQNILLEKLISELKLKASIDVKV